MIKKLLYPIVEFVYNLSGLKKRNGNIWIFGAWRGHQYSDNTKALFEYMNKEHPEVECVWLTKEKKIMKEIRSLGYKCFSQQSLGIFRYLLNAKYVFETEGMQDIPYHFLLKNTQVIQLWHGVALQSCSKWIESGAYKKGTNPWNNQYDKWIWMAASELNAETYTNYIFGVIPRKNFIITGYPRNDSFVKLPKSSIIQSFSKEHPTSKLICYMPTHRNFGEFSSGMLNKENLLYINQRLKNTNSYMIIKPHFHELKKILSFSTEYSNIIFPIDSAFGDTYSYLPYVDLLISDYSSILCDFICADKPIIIFDYDIEDMISREGEMLPVYNQFRFGPRCKSWKDVMDQVDSLLMADSWKDVRKQDFHMIQKYNDGKNCERVYKAVREIEEHRKKI